MGRVLDGEYARPGQGYPREMAFHKRRTEKNLDSKGLTMLQGKSGRLLSWGEKEVLRGDSDWDFPRPGISLDSALGTFDVENVLKERMHVQRET